MPPSLKIALVQMCCPKGAIAHNLNQTAPHFAQAVAREVDVIDFPGGGYLFAPDGRRLFATSDWSPGVAYLEIELESQRVAVL